MSAPNILVVADDDDLRGALGDALEAAGFAVLALADGQQALDALRGGDRPALILMDLMMPGMSGWELRDHLLADPALSQIPLVVVTALQRGDRRLAGMEVLHEPFSLDTLIELVRRHCPPGNPGAHR